MSYGSGSRMVTVPTVCGEWRCCLKREGLPALLMVCVYNRTLVGA